MDADIKKGGLEARFDVIILPDDSTAMITGERPPAGQGGRGGDRRAASASQGGSGGRPRSEAAG